MFPSVLFHVLLLLYYLYYFRGQNPLLTTCPNFGDHLKQAEAALQKAGHAAGNAERKITELEKKYEEFRKRFPDGIYPGDVEKYREKLGGIKQKMDTGASELNEDKIDEAKGSARDLAREAEREKNRLGKYWLANICIENCNKACQLCMESVEKKRDVYGLSEYFAEAEQALEKLRECCGRAREELINGNVQDARRMCYECLHKPNLAMAVYYALQKAYTNQIVIPSRDVPGT